MQTFPAVLILRHSMPLACCARPNNVGEEEALCHDDESMTPLTRLDARRLGNASQHRKASTANA